MDIETSKLRDIDTEEAARIAFLIARDGQAATVDWVRRGVKIYRSAVLNHAHFASSREYRRRFICSYLSFKRWLSRQEQATKLTTECDGGRTP